MNWESWLRISLPGMPAAYTLIAIWAWWHENPLPLLAPNIAFWGVVITFYLFTHLYIPKNISLFSLTFFTSVVWIVSALASHSLAEFLASDEYSGLGSVLGTRYFWFAYIFAITGMGVALRMFIKYEPDIIAHAQSDRARIEREME